MASRRNYYGNIRAPEFPADAEWLNTGRPLSLAALRGKLVLLDFWTYGCINCMHIIPDLKRLEARYPDTLVVIGVHSAKFANEGETANIRQIILRYELEHPVLNDRDFRVWRAYAVRAWPTTVLIDPKGYVLAAHSGEGVFEAFDGLIAEAIAHYTAEGALDPRPLELLLERAEASATWLSFPGKVLADETGGRLFIADSNHHRVIVTTLEGHVVAVIGSGARGLADGPFAQARFAKPQGLALREDQLYIADTENHALRLADLRSGTVRTVAGDGNYGYWGAQDAHGRPRLNSPWDLVIVGEKLYIAMAGLHQLWVYDLAQGTLAPHAGSGREGLLDGPLARAALAQPSGITSDGHQLYFADSEASAIRTADVGASGMVRTLVGQGLFDFGDVDGPWPTARLQHPLGVAWYRGTLYVADTYNHKIKSLNLAQATIQTLLGTGQPGRRDGPEAQFYEPGGLAAAGGRLYIADTNNHAIRVADLHSRQVTTLELHDAQGLLRQREEATTLPLLRLSPQEVRPGPGSVRLEVDLPLGYKVNAAAPSLFRWRSTSPLMRLSEEDQQIPLAGATFPLHQRAIFAPGKGELQGEVTLYYCPQGDDICLLYTARVEVPLTVTPEAKDTEVRIDLAIPAP